MSIIPMDRSIIPACDVATLEELENLVEKTKDVEGIGAYKIGFELVIPFGMKKVVEVIKKHSDKPIIYDHQKAGTDVPFTGERFAKACKSSGVDSVILFPQAGPVTEEAWIKACLKEGLNVMVGGEMTHPGFLKNDNGFLSDDTPTRIYTIAANLGIKDFVVPGNKPEKIEEYRNLLVGMGVEPVFYSPGLVSQGGDITASAKSAGKSWHAIVGRAIYEAKEIKNASEKLVKNII